MDALLLRIEDAAHRLSLGRSKTYELVQSGDLPVVRVGKAIRIPAAALERWVERQAAAWAAASPSDDRAVPSVTP